MKRNKITKLTASLVLTSFILTGCMEGNAKDKMMKALKEFAPEDNFTYESTMTPGMLFDKQMTILVKSELYPDVTVSVNRNRDGVITSNYVRLVHDQAVREYVTGLITPYFDCDLVEATWDAGMSSWMELEDISDEEYIERYITDNYLVYLYYEEYPSDDEISEILFQMVDDIDGACKITVYLYGVEDEGKKRGSECTCDVEFRIAADEADHVQYLDISHYDTLLENCDI